MSDTLKIEKIGTAMARIRNSQPKKVTQQDVADYLACERSVYAKYESNKLIPPTDRVEKFAEYFNINTEELMRKVSYVIPDTSALLKNRRLLDLLLMDYNKVIIPDTVLLEIDKAKDKNNKVGWQLEMTIGEYRKKYSDSFEVRKSEIYKEETRDENIRHLARDIAKKESVEVYIIHDDAGFTASYENSLLLRDYMATRSSSNNYSILLSLDEEFDHLDYYQKKIDDLNLDEYLPDGSTLLISCIRHNYDIMYPQKGKEAEDDTDVVPDSSRTKKIKFLLENNADPNKTDSSSLCFTPLTHCVQINDYKGFCLLLDYNADYNKGSINESNTSYFKTQNEGNTPLMVACWHGRKKFVNKLLEMPEICLNQQDGNGYTALMKCAIQRARRKKAGKEYTVQEDLYKLLLSKGADPLIRDRRNRTAAQLWEEGDGIPD